MQLQDQGVDPTQNNAISAASGADDDITPDEHQSSALLKTEGKEFNEASDNIVMSELVDLG